MVATQDAEGERSFPLPRFEDRLWSELELLHAEEAEEAEEAETAAAGAGAAAPRRRYLVAVGGLSAAACLTVAALAVGLDRSPGDEGGDATGPESRPATAGQTVPDDPGIVVIESPDGDTTWMDEATGEWRSLSAGGGLETAVRPTDVSDNRDGSGDFGQTVVDHEAREWWQRADRGVPFTAGLLTDLLRGQIAAGELTADGTEVDDGRELQRYVSPAGPTLLCGRPGQPTGFVAGHCSGPGSAAEEVPAGTRVVLLDPGTGRPVREILDHGVDGAIDSDLTYTFLPRSAENRALLDVEVPAGYTAVAAPPFRAAVTP